LKSCRPPIFAGDLAIGKIDEGSEPAIYILGGIHHWVWQL
jgi:hypothetical protein